MRKVLFILGELTDVDVDWMLRVGQKKGVPRGTVLIEEGRSIDTVYIVLHGMLSAYLARRDKKELARLGAGEIVGELSFIDARPPVATVEAVHDSVVLSIPVRELNSRLDKDAAFAARFYRALAVFLSSRLRRTVERLGYGEETSAEEEAAMDELDEKVLDRVHLAGARFDRMLKRLLDS
jgi:CRP/FNR family transcriptional regulator, cyclic AMP receptor protein